MTDLPDTHRQALGWLAQHGGEGLIDQHGHLIAAGDVFRGDGRAAVWLRLVTTGHVEPAGKFRLRLTPPGRAIGDRQPKPWAQPASRPHGRRMTDDLEGEFA